MNNNEVINAAAEAGETAVAASKKRKPTIASVVRTHVDELHAIVDHSALRAFARGQGWDTAASFSTFKRGLLEIGIDYAAMREGKVAAQDAALKSTVTHKLTLH